MRDKLKLKPGDSFAPFELNEAENLLSALISPLGYPYVTVKGAYDLSDDQTRANLLYTVARQVRRLSWEKYFTRAISGPAIISAA